MKTLPILRPHTGRHIAGTSPVQPFARRVPASPEVQQHEQPAPELLKQVRDGLRNIPGHDARIGEAWALLHQSAALDRQEGPAWDGVAGAASALYEALDLHCAIESGDLHWDTAYPHLMAEAGEAAGWELALQMAGEEAEAARAALGLAMSEHCRGGNTTTSTTGEAA